MDIQRIRNLTTEVLHTKMADVYEDLEYITGERGLMTHMLPNINRAVRPWLQEQITDPRFWIEELDESHTGDFPLRQMTAAESKAALERYMQLPNPLAQLGTAKTNS